MKYRTIEDVVSQAIAPALSAYDGDVDMTAVARDTFEYRVDTDSDGRTLLNTGRLEQTASETEFWDSVVRHTAGTLAVGADVVVKPGHTPDDWPTTGEIVEHSGETVVVELSNGRRQEVPADEVTPV